MYVIPSSGSGGKWQISSGGGQQPVWRRDGKEIFYLTLDSSLMSVPLSLKTDSVQAHQNFLLQGSWYCEISRQIGKLPSY